MSIVKLVRRLSAAVPTCVLAVVAAMPVVPAAAEAPAVSAFFVGQDGALYAYGRDTAAAAVGPAGLAPAGSPIAVATAGGSPSAAVIGVDGALTVGSSSADPDDGVCGNTPWWIWWPLPPPPPSWAIAVDSEVALAGLGDGQLGAFVTGTDGAVHAEWREAGGEWRTSAPTPAGLASPGGGMAVGPQAGTPPSPNPLSLSFVGVDGAVLLVHPTPGGGGDEPRPISPARMALAGGLLAASGGIGIPSAVQFIGDDGAVTAIVTSASGAWQPPFAVSPPGFSAAGGSLGATGSASEVDDYCGNGQGQPGHFHVHVPGGGPGTWVAAGPANLAARGTRVAAVQ